MRTILALSISLALLAPFAIADPTATGEVRPAILDGAPASDAVSYTHNDCVGPGLPGTAPVHGTHTTRVTGFVIDTQRPVNFAVVGLTPFGAGICPVTAVGGPVLPHDLTGQWSMQAVCRGTINEGASFFSWTVNFVAGLNTGQSYTPGTCIGYLGSAFALDVTISIGSTQLLGVPLGPVGGVQHTISQS